MEWVPSARGCLAEVRENMYPGGPGTVQEGKNVRGEHLREGRECRKAASQAGPATGAQVTERREPDTK